MEKFITIKKRICDLRVGDTFQWYQTFYKVMAIKNGRVYYRQTSFFSVTQWESFGQNSQAKVEIIN